MKNFLSTTKTGSLKGLAGILMVASLALSPLSTQLSIAQGTQSNSSSNINYPIAEHLMQMVRHTNNPNLQRIPKSPEQSAMYSIEQHLEKILKHAIWHCNTGYQYYQSISIEDMTEADDAKDQK